MVSTFNDLSVIHDDYEVGIAYGRQSVCNDKACAAAHDSLHGVLNFLFCARVYVRRGLVEDEYF